jgi:3-hydroxyacyl-[acyl-carrier-protein] dehydratase
MLLDKFYEVTEQVYNKENNTLVTRIRVNEDHEIFKGHFPDNPVMPGVCMMQISKEITSDFTGKKLFMESCSNVKFMALINPEQNPELQIELTINQQEDLITVKNMSKFKDTVALKMNLSYKIVK